MPQRSSLDGATGSRTAIVAIARYPSFHHVVYRSPASAIIALSDEESDIFASRRLEQLSSIACTSFLKVAVT